MTQDCKGKIILNKLTGIYEYVYYFSFPLDYQLICTDSNFHTRGPTLIMQVCHDDQWGRFVLEGYAFCDLPRNPGRHILECSSWRPYESLTSQIKSFFVGGATKVSDLKEIARAHENESVMNRYTLKTITAGKITVEINVCTQNAQYLSSVRSERALDIEKQQVFQDKAQKIADHERERVVLGPDIKMDTRHNYQNTYSSPNN